ncbi:MAG: UDP-N-acetylglucosamine--N-acetylmuramyl-(pentapeptide) pyrophosphoryl-undecaprenol N-acetylglucosamine transferase [Akkermansiaceae bacterium]|nr:UDP-N-acetylglucosamine--N-acetylmuramyl-(pentapeptide) pyrophosphoryl-undecaprenol N-acetylglucosamine transferase [Akkermansiaceae bacterium]
MRKEFSSAGRNSARAALGIPHDTLLLTVIGGSLGSVEVSEAVLECAPHLLQVFCKLEIHAQVRERTDRESSYSEANPPQSTSSIDTQERFRTTQFFDDMPQQLAASDIVLARAGAGTCAELLQMRVPSVLWPLATATDNHQMRNAEWMDRMGASVIFRPRTGTRTALGLATVLERVIRDVHGRERMRESAKTGAGGVHVSAHIARILMRNLKDTCA